MLDLAIAALLASAFVALLQGIGRLAFIEREFHSTFRRGAAFVALWGILVVSVFYPTVASSRGLEIDLSDMAFPSLFIGHLFLIAFLITWWGWHKPIRLADFLFLQAPRRDDLSSGLAYGALAWVLAIAASATVGPLLPGPGTGTDIPGIPPSMEWLASLPLSHKLLTIAIAMTVEEAFFRAFLQTRLGWLISSVLFALAHAGYGMPHLVISVFVVSLVIGHAFRRRGRLLPCIIAHGIFDAVQLLVVIPFAVEMVRRAT